MMNKESDIVKRPGGKKHLLAVKVNTYFGSNHNH